MPGTDDYCINTGKHGVLHGTTTDQIESLFQTLKTKSQIVLYFHGGLVPREAGMKIADKLLPGFLAVDNYPVFFVYETGFLEIVARNLTDIAGEDIFKVLLKWVLKYAIAKLRLPVGAKGIEAVQPTDIELHEELSKREEGREPFAGEPVIRDVEPVTEVEEQELREDLAQDSDLMETIEAIGKSGESEVEADAGTRGPGAGTQKSAQTLMSPEVVAEINNDVAYAESGGSRGVLTTATVLYRAGKVLVRTIDRFRHHRDHGVYPTVVEEILREFYIANIGTSIWEDIKAETYDTFVETAGQDRGGVFFLDQLAVLLATTPKASWPRINLVGHSTGGVFIDNLLAAVAQRQEAGTFAADFRFGHIVLLAPACTFWAFNEAVRKHHNLFESIRIFGMTDENESKDGIVPCIYTRSLLYFVSGVLEKKPTGENAADVPLVGMQRFYIQTSVYNALDEKLVQEYVNDGTLPATGRRSVWSRCDDGTGLNSHALSHGDFDDDLATLDSVRSIIK
jgi:hypothetical protein